MKQYRPHATVLSSDTVLTSFVAAKCSIPWFARAVDMDEVLLTIFMLSAIKIQKKK